ncbi:MAG: aminotransferase class I/II-fold pyridoxal phosphate-dependent enzyme, partial [Cyclobacteriaceae bacterium]
MKLEALVRPNIKKMKPYSSARDEFSGQEGIFLDANENPFETGLNRYPDPYQRQIKSSLSALKSIDSRSIFLGNGSDEPIDLLIRIFCEPGQDKILSIDPSYGMYSVAASINNVEVVKVPLTKNFELDADEVIRHIDPNVKIIFLCSPNNPSGNLLDKEEIRKIIRMFPGIVVIDEAYIDFSDDSGFLPELSDHPHLVV